MLNRLINKFIKESTEELTKGFTEVPLFYVIVNPVNPLEEKNIPPFEFKVHPSLEEDEFFMDKLNNLMDHFHQLPQKIENTDKQVGLFSVTFNLKKYQQFGEKGSCDLLLHPDFKGNEFIINQLNGLVDYIRRNYDMEDLST